MKVLAINGSPRKDGNTFTLLNKVLEPVKDAGIETEIVQVGGENIRGCSACKMCFKNRDRRCAVDNDIFNAVYEKMLKADGIIIGSPTYFSNVSAEVKALIDRAGLVSMANKGLLARKVGAGVVAVRRGGAVNVLNAIHHMYLICQMVIPGSTYWNFGIGLDKGDVEGDAEGMANMKNLGENIAWLLKCIEGN